jgi:hypothetical protein
MDELDVKFFVFIALFNTMITLFIFFMVMFK